MEAPVTKTTNTDNIINYFNNFCANVQNRTNASIMFVKQNDTAQKTAAAVAKYAPFVISAVGSYYAPVTLTAFCLATTFAFAKIKPQQISKQTLGNVTMGVGASIGLTALTSPFLKMIACALASGATLFYGAAFNDLLPTEYKKPKSV